MFAAILDTCVLWPSLQRDFLLSMAVEGLYRPLWSEAILAELYEHELLKHQSRGATRQEAASRAEHLLTQMRTHFDDAMVTGWEALEGTYGLRDPDDEHVVAAAIVGGAGVIVTSDHDFEPARMPAHILVSSPAQFAADTVDVDPPRAVAALTQIAVRSHSPGLTVPALLTLLRDRYDMHEVVDIVTPYLD